jgi:hypothetical protein
VFQHISMAVGTWVGFCKGGVVTSYAGDLFKSKLNLHRTHRITLYKGSILGRRTSEHCRGGICRESWFHWCDNGTRSAGSGEAMARNEKEVTIENKRRD